MRSMKTFQVLPEGVRMDGPWMGQVVADRSSLIVGLRVNQGNALVTGLGVGIQCLFEAGRSPAMTLEALERLEIRERVSPVIAVWVRTTRPSSEVPLELIAIFEDAQP